MIKGKETYLALLFLMLSMSIGSADVSPLENFASEALITQDWKFLRNAALKGLFSTTSHGWQTEVQLAGT